MGYVSASSYPQCFDLDEDTKLKEAEIKNHWFTLENQKKALKTWANQLTIETLKAWLTPYDLKEQDVPKNVLVIMAGNIPLVGFNDFVSVLITGNNVIVKMSSDDNVLLAFIAKKLIDICPEFKEGNIHALYTYAIQAEKRDQLMKHLNDKGIETKIYHKPLVSDAPVFQKYKGKDTPNARKVLSRFLSIPAHEKLSNEQIDFVIEKIKGFYS